MSAERSEKKVSPHAPLTPFPRAVWIGPLLIDELKRIVKESEITKYVPFPPFSTPRLDADVPLARL